MLIFRNEVFIVCVVRTQSFRSSHGDFITFEFGISLEWKLSENVGVKRSNLTFCQLAADELRVRFTSGKAICSCRIGASGDMKSPIKNRSEQFL